MNTYTATHLSCCGCGSSLSSTGQPLLFENDQYLILKCECSEYPVVAGIPLIFHERVAERNLSTKRLVSLIKAGKYSKALMEALTPKLESIERRRGIFSKALPSAVSNRFDRKAKRTKIQNWQSKLHELSFQHSEGSTIALLQHYFKSHPAGQAAADYFSYRFGQPKYLSTVSLAQAMPLGQGPAVDLGCGAGHFSRNLQLRNGSQPVYGVDLDFFLLWIANTRIAPRGCYVCCDLEYGMPFEDETFKSALMSNFFQFMHGKQQLARETERVMDKNTGVIALSSVRHSGFKAATPNKAIPAKRYQQLFSFPNVAVTDDMIISRYVQDMGPDLATDMPQEELDLSPMISVLATNNAAAFRAYGKFETPPHCAGLPRLNPLYRPIESATTLAKNDDYEIRWPSKQFLEDNEGITKLLPKFANRENTASSSMLALADSPEDY